MSQNDVVRWRKKRKKKKRLDSFSSLKGGEEQRPGKPADPPPTVQLRVID